MFVSLWALFFTYGSVTGISTVHAMLELKRSQCSLQWGRINIPLSLLGLPSVLLYLYPTCLPCNPAQVRAVRCLGQRARSVRQITATPPLPVARWLPLASQSVHKVQAYGGLKTYIIYGCLTSGATSSLTVSTQCRCA